MSDRLIVIDPQTGEVRQAQIFVAVLGASSLTFAMGSFGQRLPDWIEDRTRALAYIGGVPKAIVCDNLKAAVVKALWFEPKPIPTDFNNQATENQRRHAVRDLAKLLSFNWRNRRPVFAKCAD
jgi:transposase